MLQQIKALYRNRNFKLARRYSNFLSKKTEKHSLVLTLFGLKLKTLIYIMIEILSKIRNAGAF